MKLIVNIDVPDLEAGVRFYTEAFSLVHSRTIDGDVAELVGASSVIYLLKKDAETKVSSHGLASRSYERHWTPTHLDFVVNDLDAAKDQALQAGAVCESECVQWRGSKCITFSDPFGHGFCLIEFSGTSYESDG